MLKEIMISKKKVPVPIPVRTLQEALHWVGETFLKQDAAITVATLDEKDILSISEEDGQKIK